MKRSVIETVLGAIVLLLAVAFLIFSYKTADVRRVSGYNIVAAFTGTGGLAEGDDVRISGVKIGSVNKLALDPQKYLAIVTMSIDPNTKLPDDTSAIISSDSLLGGRYLELQPGGSDRMMKDGDRIQYTQAPQNLEQLLGKFIFSMSSKDDKSGQGQAAAAGANNSSTVSAAMPPSLSASPTPATNSVTIPPAPPAAAPPSAAKPKDAAPVSSTAASSASVPAAAPAVPSTSGASTAAPPSTAVATPPTPPSPAAPAVEPETGTPDAAPTALQPATTAATPPGLPGSESAMPDMTPAAQPAFQSAAPATP